MNISGERITGFLHKIFPFNLLDESDLARIIPLFAKIRLPAGMVIYRQGEIPEHFYLILSGNVRVSLSEGQGEDKMWGLHTGDSLGVEVLRSNLYRLTDAICETEVELLRMDKAVLLELCKGNPVLNDAFNLILQTFLLRCKLNLPWLGKTEKVSLISRRHPFFLVLRIVLFSSLGLAAFGLLTSLAFGANGFLIGIFILAILALILGGVLAAWAALEWTNDYFIITRERVLVQKKLIGFFDSRQESPLSAILSTGLDTSFIGRLVGYGAINLRSYTGNLRFKNLPSVHLIYELLENLRHSTEKETRQQNQDEMHELLEQRLRKGSVPYHHKPEGETDTFYASLYQSGSLLDLAARFFGLRHVKEGSVVYRTHWWILCKKTIVPALLLVGIIILVVMKFIGLMPLVSDTFVYIFALLSTIGAWGWWLYQYIDWHNDIYVITPDQLVDISRRPLGNEQRRSAPIKNIQTVEFMRKGIIGMVLNYGTVRIQIGNEELTFDNVYDPASIQAEIFAQFKRNSEKNKRLEQQKIADWISAYDQIKEGDNHPLNQGDREKNR